MNNSCIMKAVLFSFALSVFFTGCTGLIPDDSGVNISNYSIAEDNLSRLNEDRFYPATGEEIEAINSYAPPVEKMIEDLRKEGMDDENITKILEENGYGWFPETGAWWKGTTPSPEQQVILNRIRGPDYSPFPDESDERIRLCSCICRLLIVENISAGGYPGISDYSNKNEIVMNLELYGNEPMSPEYLSFEDNPLLFGALEKKYGGVELTPEEGNYALLHYNNKYFEYSGCYYVAVVGEGSCSTDICYPKDYNNLKFTADEVISITLADKDVISSIGNLDYEVSGVCISQNKGELEYEVTIQKYKDDFPYGSVILYVNMSGKIVSTGHTYPSHILKKVG